MNKKLKWRVRHRAAGTACGYLTAQKCLDKKKSYLLLCIALISMCIFAVNTYTGVSLTALTEYLKILAGILFLLSCVTLIIYSTKKDGKIYRISLYTLSLFLLVNTALIAEGVALEHHKKEMKTLERINTCEKAHIQFNYDVKNQSLKYFLFGYGVDEQLRQTLEDKYNLNVYHLGCIVTPAFECYNELVEQHLNLVELKK